MAPEQITASESIDGRSDLYALGALGYYALTGRHMFEGKTPVQIFADHLHTKPNAPSKMTEIPVPSALDAVILRCLEKDPNDRPGSAAELAELLRACEVGEWSVGRARTWWDTHGRQFEEAAGSESSPKTIAVDLARIRQRSGAALQG